MPPAPPRSAAAKDPAQDAAQVNAPAPPWPAPPSAGTAAGLAAAAEDLVREVGHHDRGQDRQQLLDQVPAHAAELGRSRPAGWRPGPAARRRRGSRSSRRRRCPPARHRRRRRPARPGAGRARTPARRRRRSACALFCMPGQQRGHGGLHRGLGGLPVGAEHAGNLVYRDLPQDVLELGHGVLLQPQARAGLAGSGARTAVAGLLPLHRSPGVPGTRKGRRRGRGAPSGSRARLRVILESSGAGRILRRSSWQAAKGEVDGPHLERSVRSPGGLWSFRRYVRQLRRRAPRPPAGALAAHPHRPPEPRPRRRHHLRPASGAGPPPRIRPRADHGPGGQAGGARRAGPRRRAGDEVLAGTGQPHARRIRRRRPGRQPQGQPRGDRPRRPVRPRQLRRPGHHAGTRQEARLRGAGHQRVRLRRLPAAR